VAGSCEHDNEPSGLIKGSVTISLSRRTVFHVDSSLSSKYFILSDTYYTKRQKKKKKTNRGL